MSHQSLHKILTSAYQQKFAISSLELWDFKFRRFYLGELSLFRTVKNLELWSTHDILVVPKLSIFTIFSALVTIGMGELYWIKCTVVTIFWSLRVLLPLWTEDLFMVNGMRSLNFL